MFKKILRLTAVAIICLSAYLYWSFSAKETLITPYPYRFTSSYAQKFQEDFNFQIKAAEKAKILIIGDRMGLSLEPYIGTLQEEFKNDFKDLPSVYNWSATNEGLFRTLFKLKQLKKIPPVIIYFGASSELFEQRFKVSKNSEILRNFKSFDQENIISLIITFPWLSKIFYSDMELMNLEALKLYKNNLPGSLKLNEREVAFKLFEYEIKELIEFVKEKKSNLIFFTTPLNLEAAPREICSHATSEGVVGIQQEIDQLIQNGEYKSALSKAEELSGVTFSNARTFHQLGQSAAFSGNLELAKDAYIKAILFDCENWRGNSVYNAIIKNYATKSALPIIDFEQYMNAQLSKDGLFFDEIYPQNLFYQAIMKDLADTLKKILSVYN